MGISWSYQGVVTIRGVSSSIWPMAPFTMYPTQSISRTEKLAPSGQLDLGSLLRDELGLGGHDGPARAALGQLIPGPLPAVDVFDVGDDLGLHEALDEGGLARPNRTHHTKIYISVRAESDVLVNR